MISLERLNEIRHFVVTTYPDSCLASNYGDVSFEEYERYLLIEELDNYFWNEHMNLCSCGTPEDCKNVICEYLIILNKWTSNTKIPKDFKTSFGVDSIYDNPFTLFLAYAIDSYGFTEHGSSIGGAWITDLGRMYIDVLLARKE